MIDPNAASAAALAAAIASSEVSSREIVAASLDRIEATADDLNAVVQVVAERALAEARESDAEAARGELRGPLHGVPITVKDSLDTEGIISTGGTLGRSRFVPERDAVAVGRLRAAGAIVVGKTNTPEFAGAGVTDNLVYGRTNNPYDVGRTPGGSSGGSAAILAAGGSSLDIGTDTGGSVRRPAHFCGIAGLKPTAGRVPRTGGVVPPGGVLDEIMVVGPMSRHVEDLSLALQIMAGPDVGDTLSAPVPFEDPGNVDVSSLRVAVHTDNGLVSPTADVVAAVESAAAALEPHIAEVEYVVPPHLDEALDVYYRCLHSTAAIRYRKLLEASGTEQASSFIADRIGPDAKPTPSVREFLGTLDDVARLKVSMRAIFDSYDLVLCPVAIEPAPRHEDMGGKGITYTSYTCVYNLAGWPAGVVRAGASAAGLPIGVQVVGPPWREDLVLAALAVVEESLGGWQPPGLVLGS